MTRAGRLINQAVENGFAESRIKPMEFGGVQGTSETRDIVLKLVDEMSI